MDLKQLNEKLADFPYVNGYTPTQADTDQLKKLSGDYSKYVHVKRWVNHMKSFSLVPSEPAGKAPAPNKGGDDDDIDLFGSDDDEEAEKAKAERAKQLEAQKKGGKPAVVGKSSVVLDIKVWDDETDLKEVETQVRAIQKDGLTWGASKIAPVAFGMNKLQLGCVVIDEKISIDWLTEQIEELELVQSTDVAAFQKI